MLHRIHTLLFDIDKGRPITTADLDEAEPLAIKVLESDRECIPAYFALARINELRRRPKVEEFCMLKILEIDPQSENARLGLEALYTDYGRKTLTDYRLELLKKEKFKVLLDAVRMHDPVVTK